MLYLRFRLITCCLPSLQLLGSSMFVLRVLLLPYRFVSLVCYIQFQCFSSYKITCILLRQRPSLSVFILSGNPYKLKFCFRKFNTSLVSDDLQILAFGHLLNLSFAISIGWSPFSFLLVSFTEKSI